MGRIFLEHLGGARLFSCASCDANLTNRSELISTRFTGATGRAFLFNRVVNIKCRLVYPLFLLYWVYSEERSKFRKGIQQRKCDKKYSIHFVPVFNSVQDSCVFHHKNGRNFSILYPTLNLLIPNERALNFL